MAEDDATAQAALNLGSVVDLDTPVAWELADFTPWEKFQWDWRITGICAECHVFAYLRERLAKRGIMTAYDAMRQKAGTRVTVAGLNIRPHRPRTVSGNPVLFTLIEDETEMLQAGAFGETIQETTLVFLTSPAVLVRGTIERRGSGCSLLIEKAKPLRMQDFVGDQAGDVMAAPPSQRTYTGTKITSESTESIAVP